MAGLLFNKFKGDMDRVLLEWVLREMLQALGEIRLQDRQGLLNVIIFRVKGIWQGSALSIRGQGMMHDPRIADGQDTQPTIIRNAPFQTDDLDAYDSDCDDISSTKAILMSNLSSYGSDILSEVPQHDSYQNNDMHNQSVQETHNFEQSLIDYVPNNEITTNWDKANQEIKIVNESLTAKLERYKERVKTFEQRLNVDLSSREKLIDSQMDDMIRNRNALKQEIDSLKQNLSKQVKEKESLLQTLTVFKKESKEKENKYMDKEIDLENKIKNWTILFIK
ncbi:hypothetical protein Tco_1105704 [Tanacetum coccineum]